MNRYHITAVRRSDAAEGMPFESAEFVIRADTEDAAEFAADAAICRLVGIGQMDIDSVWEMA